MWIAYILPMLAAIILGGVLGLERNLAGKTAGMRTYAMVSLGSALFVIISNSVFMTYFKAGVTSINPLVMASNVIVGIGFIGAGLVFLKDNKITGLTTAAGLWVSAGVGMACGFGLYSLAIAAVIMALIVFTGMWLLENSFERGMSYADHKYFFFGKKKNGEVKEGTIED